MERANTGTDICTKRFSSMGCTGEQLAAVPRHVIHKTSEISYDVVCVVTDNHKINVAAMEVLGDGELQIHAPHPTDVMKNIFLAFDQSYIIKNIRPQFLAKDTGEQKEMSSAYPEEDLQNAKELNSKANKVPYKKPPVPYKY
ncbi:hypothetical protein HPB50_023208 [Hyalomma asiaticum]|uniref:Uncharacterized protein n=1 Tax=Hyalomma asiaticum TaxID=266040 RepID=A0ACB7TQB5_HYAAI|nr:hypothetical protein HPB50_023208 [Hyalomma asiaticum]